MTLKELIIGHYEGDLTSEQQASLQDMLERSPEARSLYEQYGAMEEAMEEESRKLVPPVALRDATLVGAMGVAVESIGGGILAWFTSKAAVVLGTVVVAGTAVGLVIASNDEGTDAATTPETPSVEHVQETDTKAEPPVLEENAGVVQESTAESNVENSPRESSSTPELTINSNVPEDALPFDDASGDGIQDTAYSDPLLIDIDKPADNVIIEGTPEVKPR